MFVELNSWGYLIRSTALLGGEYGACAWLHAIVVLLGEMKVRLICLTFMCQTSVLLWLCESVCAEVIEDPCTLATWHSAGMVVCVCVLGWVVIRAHLRTEPWQSFISKCGPQCRWSEWKMENPRWSWSRVLQKDLGREEKLLSLN